MKNYLTILFIIIYHPLIFGQNDLNKLSAPTSPASSILGLQPKTVLSPKSYQALETSIYTNFMNSEGNAIIPNDFAIEFTPYWTKNHHLSLYDYLYPKNFYEQTKRNSSFSLASSQNYLLGDSTSTNAIGFGYRNTLYFSNKGDYKKVQDFRTKLKNAQSIRPTIAAIAESLIANNPNIKNSIDLLDKIKPIVISVIFDFCELSDTSDAEELTNEIYQEAKQLEVFSSENLDNFLDAFYSLIVTKLNSEAIFSKFELYIKERQGFYMDIAFANSLIFPTNTFEFSILPRHSFWVTPTYRFNEDLSFLKIICVFRYEWYNVDYYKKYFPKSIIYQNNTDYGLAVSGEFKKFTIQFEAVGRSSNSEIPAGTDIEGNELFRKEKNNDLQYIGSFSYNLRDQLVLTYSFGNRFDPIQNPGNTLVSLLTLNFGFGSPTMSTLDIKR